MALSVVLNLYISFYKAQVAVEPSSAHLSEAKPTSAVVEGCCPRGLNSFELLSKLSECFPRLIRPQLEDVGNLIKLHVSLFSDVPTHVLQHDLHDHSVGFFTD